MRGLRSFDLNLLVALEAFVTERNVTRAAARLGLSQPAASNALRRLRELFRDQLLVRTPNGMSPTERALELREELAPILARVRGLFESSIHFDPAASARQFRIRLSDLLETLLLPRLLATAAARAPGISFGVVHLSPTETVDALEREHVDIAVSTGLKRPNSIRSLVLRRDRLVCAMSGRHRLAGKPLTTDRFMAERHIRVSVSTTDERFVEGALRAMSLDRRIALHVQHWAVVADILRDTDLLCVMPESFARRLGPGFRLSPLPFGKAEFDWEIYWHMRGDNLPSRRWLAALIVESWPEAAPDGRTRRAAAK